MSIEQGLRRGLPLVICAPSGAGKSTLVGRLTAEFPMEFSISYNLHLLPFPTPGDFPEPGI